MPENVPFDQINPENLIGSSLGTPDPSMLLGYLLRTRKDLIEVLSHNQQLHYLKPDLEQTLANVLHSLPADIDEFVSGILPSDKQQIWNKAIDNFLQGKEPSEFYKIFSRRTVDPDLLKLEERWHFAVEGINDGLWDWNLIKGEVFYSKRWKEMLGYDESDIGANYNSWKSLLHPGDAANAKDKLNRYLAGESDKYIVEYRFLCKDGSWRWILDRGKIIEYTAEGKPARIIGTHKDISDRKAKELTIRKLNERLTLANKAAQIGIWDWDPVKKHLEWDENMHLLYGLEYGTQKITTDAWIGLVHPDDRHKVFTFFNLLAHSEGGKEIIFRITKPDGTIRHLKSSGETEIDPEGNPKRMIGVNYDITEVIRQEEVIRQNENIFQAAFDHSAVGMSLTSLEGKYFKVNEALCRILGYDQEDLISKSFREISVPDDLEQNLQYFEQARKGERDTYEMEKRYYHKSGSIIWVYLNVSVVKDQEGTPLFFISQVQDITLRKTAETKIKEHLHELQRWHEATLGRENRIMDLKREVNILLQESGKPPRYFSVL